MKKFLIVANWKLNHNKKSLFEFLKFLHAYLYDHNNRNIISIAPSFVYLDELYKNINDKNLCVTAQNVDFNLQGAFTGEISVLMLQDIGVRYVLLGHSERRMFHHEDNNMIAKKFHLIKSYNLVPILCIGETEEERKLNQTHEVLKNQINCIFNMCGNTAFRNTIIAYEPIWAIGTGQSANSNDVQKIHKFIKKYIQAYDYISANNLIIQYGGSINSLNAKVFLTQPDIDGLLVGNASLQYKEFIKIIEIANNID